MSDQRQANFETLAADAYREADSMKQNLQLFTDTVHAAKDAFEAKSQVIDELANAVMELRLAVVKLEARVEALEAEPGPFPWERN